MTIMHQQNVAFTICIESNNVQGQFNKTLTLVTNDLGPSDYM